MKIALLDGFTTNPGDLSYDWINKYGEATVYDRTPKDLIYERLAEADIAIINKTPIDRETMERLPKLKYIGLMSTGYNIVDIEFAREKNIIVTNIPDYSSKAVAQLVFAYILNFSNRVNEHDEAVKNGEWTNCQDFCFYKTSLTELYNKTIGIIGYGKIGSETARLANAFYMNTLSYTPHPDKATDNKVRFVGIDELLRESDYVSMHCPLNSATNNMVNKEFLLKMKKSAYLINTSRGQIVNESDLSYALNKKIIAGAAVDVLSTEPPTRLNPLLKSSDCIITPHIAWAAKETRARLMKILEENLAAYISGNPINQVN